MASGSVASLVNSNTLNAGVSDVATSGDVEKEASRLRSQSISFSEFAQARSGDNSPSTSGSTLRHSPSMNFGVHRDSTPSLAPSTSSTPSTLNPFDAAGGSGSLKRRPPPPPPRYNTGNASAPVTAQKDTTTKRDVDELGSLGVSVASLREKIQ